MDDFLPFDSSIVFEYFCHLRLRALGIRPCGQNCTENKDKNSDHDYSQGHRHKGSDTSVYALLYKLITHLALRQSRHKPPHCKITNAITVIPPTTPYNPNSLFSTAVNTHQPQNSPIMSAYSDRPYAAMMLRKI